MENQELRECPSYPGRQVTADGRVWSTLRCTWIRPYMSGGYLATKYRGRTVGVHQLVADAFHGPCPPGYEVNHLDLDKQHNAADNLEYLTHRGNMVHACQMRGYDTRETPYQLPPELCDPESPRLRRMLAYLRGDLSLPGCPTGKPKGRGRGGGQIGDPGGG